MMMRKKWEEDITWIINRTEVVDILMTGEGDQYQLGGKLSSSKDDMQKGLPNCNVCLLF